LIISVIFWRSNGLNQTVSSNNEHKTAQSINKLPTALTLNMASDSDEGGIDIEEVYKSAAVVFVGKYLGDNRVFSIGDHINTEASFEVTKVLKGNIPSDRMKNNIVKVQYYGGEVTLDEFYNNMTNQMKNDPKNKIGSIPVETRKKEKVVQYVKKQSLKDKTKNQEYLVCVSDNPVNSMQPNPYYFNLFQEYGISKVDANGNVYNPDTQTFRKVSFYTK
jgi:hypothetical protein